MNPEAELDMATADIIASRHRAERMQRVGLALLGSVAVNAVAALGVVYMGSGSEASVYDVMHQTWEGIGPLRPALGFLATAGAGLMAAGACIKKIFKTGHSEAELIHYES